MAAERMTGSRVAAEVRGRMGWSAPRLRVGCGDPWSRPGRGEVRGGM